MAMEWSQWAIEQVKAGTEAQKKKIERFVCLSHTFEQSLLEIDLVAKDRQGEIKTKKRMFIIFLMFILIGI